MRPIGAPFVVVPPSGARIRTRLRVDAADEQVLVRVGEHLGRLAGGDLAALCRSGRFPDQQEGQRTARKRALTTAASSRWAGAITRTSGDQWERGYANLLDARVGLRRAIQRLQSRLRVTVGQRQGRVSGYATQAERFGKQRRLQHLQARLAKVEKRIAAGRVSVCRGGRRHAKLRHRVGRDAGALTEVEWRAHWQAERWFLTADGEADKRWGNETIRVHPDLRWLELRLPTPLAHLSNTPGRAVTYRLGCPVVFNHRRDEWAAQASSGAVRYDLWYDSIRGRWYVDASWRLVRPAMPRLEELRQDHILAVDLNAAHLDCWVLDPSGNPIRAPHTIPLELDGLPASVRDGRLRAAITAIVRLAIAHGCRSVTVEDLDFADVRQAGRETLGRGKRGKSFRRTVSEIPTRQFRDLLVGMAANAGLWIVAVDPGWTSRWGRRYWQTPLDHSTRQAITITAHHAAAVVIGRRALGLGARRRPGVTRPHQRMGKGELPARPSVEPWAVRNPGLLEANGQRHRRARPVGANGSTPGDQVVQDRPVPPVRVDKR
jgi:hypothetical protein